MSAPQAARLACQHGRASHRHPDALLSRRYSSAGCGDELSCCATGRAAVSSCRRRRVPAAPFLIPPRPRPGTRRQNRRFINTTARQDDRRGSVVRGAVSARPPLPSTWVACRQDRGHQMPQRADEIVLAHQHGALAGVQDIDGAAGSRPVGRGMARTCSMRFSQRPASVRPEVSSARRRIFPSPAISVITTLTLASVPALAPSLALHLWRQHECRKVQWDTCHARATPAASLSTRGYAERLIHGCSLAGADYVR